MKIIYVKAIEVNNVLNLNVDEQQDDLKHVKEQCDIDDEDEVQEIQASRILMKKGKAVYVTCHKKLAIKNGLENISRKSTLSCGIIMVAKYSEI